MKVKVLLYPSGEGFRHLRAEPARVLVARD